MPPRPDWVTSVLSAVIAPDDRVYRWAWKQGRDGILLDDARKASPATARGHAVHRAMEDLKREGQERAIELFEVSHRTYVEALYKWHRETRPEILACEFRVFSAELAVSGKVDLLRACTRAGCECEGAGVAIEDFKTGWVDSPKEHLQVGGAYPLLFRATRPGYRVCETNLIGLNLDGDGEWESVPATGTEGEFLAALNWFRQLKRREAEAAQARHRGA